MQIQIQMHKVMNHVCARVVLSFAIIVCVCVRTYVWVCAPAQSPPGSETGRSCVCLMCDGSDPSPASTQTRGSECMGVCFVCVRDASGPGPWLNPWSIPARAWLVCVCVCVCVVCVFVCVCVWRVCVCARVCDASDPAPDSTPAIERVCVGV